jgi:hypothetical protein
MLKREQPLHREAAARKRIMVVNVPWVRYAIAIIGAGGHESILCCPASCTVLPGHLVTISNKSQCLGGSNEVSEETKSRREKEMEKDSRIREWPRGAGGRGSGKGEQGGNTAKLGNEESDSWNPKLQQGDP